MTSLAIRPLSAVGVMGLVLRLLVAAGLSVSAYVHADLAPVYDGVRASISQGNLFRIDAAAASLAALVVLVVGRRRRGRPGRRLIASTAPPEDLRTALDRLGQQFRSGGCDHLREGPGPPGQLLGRRGRQARA